MQKEEIKWNTKDISDQQEISRKEGTVKQKKRKIMKNEEQNGISLLTINKCCL